MTSIKFKKSIIDPGNGKKMELIIICLMFKRPNHQSLFEGETKKAAPLHGL